MKRLQAGDRAIIMQSPTGTGKGFIAAYMFYRCIEANKSIWFIVHGKFVIDTFCIELSHHGAHTYKCDTCHSAFDADVITARAGIGKSEIDQENYTPIPCYLTHASDKCAGEIKQTDGGIPHTRFQAGQHYDGVEKAVVASIDTITRRYFSKNSKYDPEDLDIPDYIIVDECRKVVSPSCQLALDWYMERGTKIVGLDATPKAKGLSDIYDYLSHGQSTPWHIQEGNLCPIVHYAPNLKDTEFIEAVKELRVSGEDFNQSDLDTLSENTVLIGNVVEQYERITEEEFGTRKPFVVACVSRAHASAVQSAFLEAGIPVDYVDGETPQEERDKIEERLLDGSITGVVSVLVMIYGVSIKCLQIAILARPVRNVTVYLQFGGRVLRPFEDKQHAVMIDMGKAVHDIGYVDDAYTWDLDSGTYLNDTREEREKETAVEHVDITCYGCSFVYKNSPICPQCGTKNIISYTETGVVYYNKELIKQHKDMLESKSKWEEEQAFKAMTKDYVSGLEDLSNFQKLCKFNDIVYSKYKHTMLPQEVVDIQPQSDDGAARKYDISLTIRRNAFKKRRRR